MKISTLVIKNMIILLILVSFLSCHTSKELTTKLPCEFDHESNSIIGRDIGAKEFYHPTYYIKCAVEELVNDIACPQTMQSEEFGYALPIEFIGYRIKDCADTTWAKEYMANHLLDKYNISRTDTIVYDTVYLVRLVDTSKLRRDTMYISGAVKMNLNATVEGEDIRYRKYNGLDWKKFTARAIPPELRQTNYVIERDTFLEGTFSLQVPHEIYPNYGLDYYSKHYLENQGISMEFLRIDTVYTGYYEYIGD